MHREEDGGRAEGGTEHRKRRRQFSNHCGKRYMLRFVVAALPHQARQPSLQGQQFLGAPGIHLVPVRHVIATVEAGILRVDARHLAVNRESEAAGDGTPHHGSGSLGDSAHPPALQPFPDAEDSFWGEGVRPAAAAAPRPASAPSEQPHVQTANKFGDRGVWSCANSEVRMFVACRAW